MLPVVDFTIEDIPVEEGIARLYQRQEAAMQEHSPHMLAQHGGKTDFPWLRKYTKAFEMGFQTALEYRVNFLISLISAAYPIFYPDFSVDCDFPAPPKTAWSTATPTARCSPIRSWPGW